MQSVYCIFVPKLFNKIVQNICLALKIHKSAFAGVWASCKFILAVETSQNPDRIGFQYRKGHKGRFWCGLQNDDDSKHVVNFELEAMARRLKAKGYVQIQPK